MRRSMDAWERDFYVTDLWQLFRAVQERSAISSVWENALKTPEFPTPYAYLLYEIGADLRALSASAFQHAFISEDHCQLQNPGMIAHASALSWSFCVWSIADSKGKVSDSFRLRFIQEYLLFVLSLGWQPSEVIYAPTPTSINGLTPWRDLFLNELQKRFSGAHSATKELQNAIESLDHGKSYVFAGYKWLFTQLLG